MKKFYLLLLVTLAIVSFLFFTPVMLFILGLSCVGLGIISLVNPQRMSFQIIHRASVVRLVGIAFMIGGIAASLGGGNLIYDFYLNNQSNQNIISSDAVPFNPNRSGSEAVRPGTNPSALVTTPSTPRTNSNTPVTSSKTPVTKSNTSASTSSTTQHSSQTIFSTSSSPGTSTNTSTTATTSNSANGKAVGLSKKAIQTQKDHPRK